MAAEPDFEESQIIDPYRLSRVICRVVGGDKPCPRTDGENRVIGSGKLSRHALGVAVAVADVGTVTMPETLRARRPIRKLIHVALKRAPHKFVRPRCVLAVAEQSCG